ncbi:MAG: Beta-barrel assembly-enhancing protease [Phycisphaerae bacterium]|nr:Beta-barrel assembly-enhancing protease [Phycisphaerae bacterium]
MASSLSKPALEPRSFGGADSACQETREGGGEASSPIRALMRLQNLYRAQDLVRRGVCLLNAGQIDAAERCLREAMSVAPRERSAAECLVSAYREERPEAVGAASAAHARTSARVRLAWLQQRDGRGADALRTLREGVAEAPEDAELQHQLGLMLASREEYEEAEVRFTQAVTLDRGRVEAWVNLAMCQGASGRSADAVRSLQRAQRIHRHDARIALLLAQAFQAARSQGAAVRMTPAYPVTDVAEDGEEIEALTRMVERDPEFVDAMLSIPASSADERVYALLMTALREALGRRPDHADLHYHLGRVLSRLGRADEAIAAGERAVALDSRHTRALIDLARWYRSARRWEEAVDRLERVVRAGFEYPDVYRDLGELHRERGRTLQARSAYRRALALKPDDADSLAGLAALAEAGAAGD